MRFEIRNRPSYALLEVELMPGESIEAEAGAMTYMTPNIRVNTKIREESFLSALGLKILGGQSFFVNEYTASERPGELLSFPLPWGTWPTSRYLRGMATSSRNRPMSRQRLK
jgi:uncharacterized protein (AIM24 family)